MLCCVIHAERLTHFARRNIERRVGVRGKNRKRYSEGVRENC